MASLADWRGMAWRALARAIYSAAAAAGVRQCINAPHQLVRFRARINSPSSLPFPSPSRLQSPLSLSLSRSDPTSPSSSATVHRTNVAAAAPAFYYRRIKPAVDLAVAAGSGRAVLGCSLPPTPR
jgi:hypothetical protein